MFAQESIKYGVILGLLASAVTLKYLKSGG